MANSTTAPRSGGLLRILLLRRGRRRFDVTDWLTYGFLLLGFLILFLPVLMVVVSSFKTEANLSDFPPTFLPYQLETVHVPGHDKPLPLFKVTQPDGSIKTMAQIKSVGRLAQMIDPKNPDAKPVTITVNKATPIKKMRFSLSSYQSLLAGTGSRIWLYIYNTLFITVVATLITIIMNSMAAYALSKYKFRGQNAVLVTILSTLMIPATVVLVPVFLIVSELGLAGNLWGVILPTVATPTGVFLLRQYMLTIPDELIEAARMDHASEWRIFWRIVLPLSGPAVAVVAIFSILSRWNDFLLPLVILNQRDVYTLQLALSTFQTEYETRYDLLLAMTTLTALPLAAAFIFLQRYITTGIATTGIK